MLGALVWATAVVQMHLDDRGRLDAPIVFAPGHGMFST